jgi:hypothetical protein
MKNSINVFFLTKFLGSKNRCSFHVQTPVAPISSFEVENFFSFNTEISIMGSTVLPSGTLIYLAFSIKT